MKGVNHSKEIKTLPPLVKKVYPCNTLREAMRIKTRGTYTVRDTTLSSTSWVFTTCVPGRGRFPLSKVSVRLNPSPHVGRGTVDTRAPVQ